MTNNVSLINTSVSMTIHNSITPPLATTYIVTLTLIAVVTIIVTFAAQGARLQAV